MNITEIKEMSTLERLQAMEELWGVLCLESKTIDSPAWHGEILKERQKKIDSGTAEYISIEDLKAGKHL